MNPSAVHIRDLTKSFPEEFSYKRLLRGKFRRARKEVLKGVSLEIPAGTLTGLVGENGAGKTTLLKVLGTLLLKESGEVCVLGQPIETCGRLVGYVLHEERSFYWRLSVYENLRFFAGLSGLHGQNLKTRIEEVLVAVGLMDRAKEKVRTLSSGLRQRLSIARALLLDPAVLLFDEATKSLDLRSAEDMRRLILRELVERQKKTVIYATHQLLEIREFCTTSVVMHAGRVEAVGNFKAIEPVIERVFFS